MTDGEPNEQSPPGNGLPWSSDGNAACNNVKAEATAAKAEGTIVATIAFRLEGVKCSSDGAVGDRRARGDGLDDGRRDAQRLERL